MPVSPADLEAKELPVPGKIEIFMNFKAIGVAVPPWPGESLIF
jgi:hypothetical protein